MRKGVPAGTPNGIGRKSRTTVGARRDQVPSQPGVPLPRIQPRNWGASRTMPAPNARPAICDFEHRKIDIRQTPRDGTPRPGPGWHPEPSTATKSPRTASSAPSPAARSRRSSRTWNRAGLEARAQRRGRALMHPLILQHQITPKTSRYTRCSMSMLPNVSINGRIRSSGQLGRWWYSISPCRNSECVRRFTVFAFNQRS